MVITMQDRKLTILYIDDDQDCLDAVRVMLESQGYGMVEARSAEAGLEVYRETRPDVSQRGSLTTGFKNM